MKYIIYFFSILFILNSTDNKRYISIEWEKIPEAKEYFLQISNSKEFKKFLYQEKTKEASVKLSPNPEFKFGRIAAIDLNGVRGEFSDVFEIEQRIVEPKVFAPLPENILPKDHLIKLEIEKESLGNSFFKINDGDWFHYNEGIILTKEGQNNISYYSINPLGKKEEVKKKTYILDTEAPKVFIKFNETVSSDNKIYYTNKNTKIQIKALDEFSEVKEFKVFLNTNTKSTEIELVNDSFVIPNNFHGEIFELAIYVEDRIGNRNTIYRVLRHDIEPPILDIQFRTNQDLEDYLVQISLDAVDPISGVDKIYYSINSENYLIFKDKLYFTEEGEYVLKFYAVDNVGNRTNLQIEKIRIPKKKKKS